MFQPTASPTCPLPLNAIVDDKQQAFWPTFNAGSSTAAYAHHAVWKQALASPSIWLNYDRLDLSMLMLPGLLVRRRVANGTPIVRRSQDFMLVLGVVERVAVLAWECDIHIAGGKELRRPRCAKPRDSNDLPYSWLVVVNPDEWEAIPIKWLPPVAQVWRHMVHASSVTSSLPGRTGATSSSSGELLASGIFIEEAASACSLLQASALQGFRGLGVVALRALAKYLQLELAQTSTMFEVLVALVKHGIPHCGEEQLAKILSDYAHAEYPGQDDIINSEAMKECLNPGDIRELDNFAESSKKVEPLRQEISDYIKKVVSARSAGASRSAPVKGRGRAQGSGKGAAAPKPAPKRTPVRRPQNVMQPDDVVAALPTDGWKIRKDFYNNRWFVSHPLLGHLSRSWTLYGDATAAAMCLNFAWAKEAEVNAGLGPCPHLWVVEAHWNLAASSGASR